MERDLVARCVGRSSEKIAGGTPAPRKLLGGRGGLSRASVLKDKQSPLFIGDVDVAAGVDEHVFGLAHQLIVRGGHAADGGSGWYEPSGLLRQARVLDVIDPQAGVEVGEVDQVRLLFHVRVVLQNIGVVRAKTASL